VDALPFAVPLGQLVPLRAGPQNPEHAIDKQAVFLAMRPESDFLPGNISAIRAHSALLNSYCFAVRRAPNQLLRSAMIKTYSLWES
jgi:hypothetical protein